MRRPDRLVLPAGLVVALGIVALLAPWADSSPDGLERVAADKGFAATEREHTLERSPIAGYSIEGVENERLSTALSGVLGVLVAFAAGAGLLVAMRVLKRRTAARSRNQGA